MPCVGSSQRPPSPSLLHKMPPRTPAGLTHQFCKRYVKLSCRTFILVIIRNPAFLPSDQFGGSRSDLLSPPQLQLWVPTSTTLSLSTLNFAFSIVVLFLHHDCPAGHSPNPCTPQSTTHSGEFVWSALLKFGTSGIATLQQITKIPGIPGI